MKGVIFNLLEQVVTDEFGADMWDDLLDDAGLQGAYSSLGNYPDEQVEALVEAAAKRTGLSRSQVLHWFGKRAMPILRDLYPSLFAPHANSEQFVASVNRNIHPEVRKLYPEAECPFFHIRTSDEHQMKLHYKSQRDMIDLAHGFIDGAAGLYGDQVETSVVEPAAGGKREHLHVHWRVHAK